MKKAGLVLLAVFAVLAIVLTAGCVTTTTDNPTPAPTQGSGASGDVSLAINIEKTGITYNIGDTMDIYLPSNPSTGYSWAVKSADEGLEVIEIPSNDNSASTGLVGAPTTQRFTVKALDSAKDGNYSFTIVYKKAGEEAGIFEYTDVLHVKKTDDEPIARSIFKFEGNEYTVTVGEKVTVSVNGNPTTGYVWAASQKEGDNAGLNISEPVYKQNDAEEGMAGVPGVYTWTITADTPGAYYFTAFYQRSWEDEPIGRIIVPICFTVE
ncbi:MAG TPA: protease inhibitor I42 family protein [Methanocorpusculum sp.]|nr:protease inhibitor I42 family protein [Methanocorpusculum sp.]